MKHYPLSNMQSDMFMEWNENPETTQFNMAGYLLFEKGSIDRERLAKAVDKLLEIHPYLYNRLIEVEDDESLTLKNFDDPFRTIRQYPEYNQEIKLQFKEMSDEDFQKYISSPTPIYDPFNDAMIRFNFIETPTYDVFTIDMFHILVDGISIKKINNDVEALYRNEEVESDGLYFYNRVEKEYAAWDSDSYLADKQFFEEKFSTLDGLTDFANTDSEDDGLGKSLFFEKNISWKKVDEWAANHGCSSANLTMAIYAKTLSQFTGHQKVAFYTPNHNRSKKEIINPFVGNVLCSSILVIDVEPELSILDLAGKVKMEMFSALRHKTYPISHYFINHELNDYATEFLYDGPYMEFTGHYDDQVCYWRWFDFGNNLEHLSVTVYQRGENYAIEADCSEKLYSREQIEKFITLYYQTLSECIEQP